MEKKILPLLFLLLLSLYSMGQIAPTLTVPRGHKDVVRNCYFTPNDKYLISTDYDHVLCIWDGDDGRQIFTLRDSLASFHKLEINNASTFIAALSDSGQLYIIDFTQLKIKTKFYDVTDFSMNKTTGTIFFITSNRLINKYEPRNSSITHIRTDKYLRSDKIITVSETNVAIQEQSKGVLILNTITGKALPVGERLSIYLKLEDYHPSGYLLCTFPGNKSTTFYRFDVRNPVVKEKIELEGKIISYDCAFTADPKIIISTWQQETEEYNWVMNSPALYSFKTGRVIDTLGIGSEYVSVLGEMNLNFSRRSVIARSVIGYEYERFIRYDFSKNSMLQVLGRNVKNENYSKFACANNSKKIAVFNKDLLLPAIYPEGSMNSNGPAGMKKYNNLTIDISKSPDKIKSNRFSFLFSNEMVINDSVVLVTSDTTDNTPDHYTATLYRRDGNFIKDSFCFFYHKLIKPSVNAESIFWSADSVFYVLDPSRFLITDSISFPGIKIESLWKEGKDILIERENVRACKYNILQKKITDTAAPGIPLGLMRPYIENDYARSMEGMSPSQSEINDYDYVNGVVSTYPFMAGRIDSIGIYDSTGEIISYQAMVAEPYVRFTSLDSSNNKYSFLSAEIDHLPVLQVRYWNDSCYIILTKQNRLFVYSFSKDSVIRRIDCPTSSVVSFGISSLFVQEHNKYLVVSDKVRNDCFIVDVAAGQIIAHLKGYYNPQIRQPADLLILEDAAFGNFYIYSNKTYQYVSLVTPFSKTDYVVNTSSGLFDGTDKAIENLYLLIDDATDKIKPWKTIDLAQLKAKYYIPGLWDKLITGDSTDLPDVESIKTLSLAPEIIPDSSWSFSKPFKVTLLDKGGGIGAVRMVINGKEVIADARKNKIAAGKKLTLAIDLQPYKKYFSPGNNTIQVFSSNTDSSLTSKGLIVASSGNSGKQADPKLFVISIGTSDYKGTEIDLQYSAKDALDIAKALKAGSQKLFGADSTFVYTLTSNATDTMGLPSKQNISRVFAEVSKLAAAKDIIVLYLSGHGINTSGTQGDFYYLTKEAYTANPSAYTFKEVLKYVGISSNEFTEYLKNVAARKQLFIIDACASGKMVENLIAHRDIPYGTLKALDRLKDRTGTHIITGCAADAVSYEASRFGQGILTYSLLEGMKGASLRDNKFLDVAQWFQYARERVPQLATGLGGIQTPQVYSPSGNQSFDIAELDEDEKKQVPLSQEKPVFIKSIFQEEEKFFDVLSVAKGLDSKLNEISSTDKNNSFIFFPVDEFANAYQVLGRYKSNQGQIEAVIKIIKPSSQEIVSSFSVTAADVQKVSSAIIEKIRELK